MTHRTWVGRLLARVTTAYREPAAWRSRFLAHQPEIRRMGFDERFLRMWEFYLASCEAAFATGYIGNLQMVLGRSREARRIEA